jgi:DNA polymerase
MPVLHRDFESRSAIDLTAVGARRYAADVSTEVLCIGYAVDDGPVQIWTSAQPIPEAFHEAARDPAWIVVAHNDGFETAVEELVLGPRFGWPLVPLERHRCTMVAALAAALPASLEDVATALELTTQKDAVGRRATLLMAKPRRPRKGEDPNVVHWHDDWDLRPRLADYCRRDVEIERELYNRLPPLSNAEQQVWQLDALVNRRGFGADRGLAMAASRIVTQEQAHIQARIGELTDGAITSVNQTERILKFIRERGHALESLNKRAVASLLDKDDLTEDVRQILELRQQGGRASVSKLDTLLASVDADDRVRGCFRYHAASTGRWSGQGFQPQNLKKPEQKNKIEVAIKAVLSGDLARVRALGSPLSILGDISRSMICATRGNVLIGADFSAIESRVLAWIAGENWKLATYRRFDTTGDPAIEPYCVTASKILKRTVTPNDETGRQIGKTCDLAFGYGGGLGAWRKFDNSNTYSDEEVEAFKQAWRTEHVSTVRLWHAIFEGACHAIRTGRRRSLGRLAFEHDGVNLYLALPSGRRITYPQARVRASSRFERGEEIVFRDNAKGGWSEVAEWYGTFTENVVQAISRDLLAGAMLRLEAAGFPVVLHVHDEAVCEVPEDAADTERFVSIMTALPDWAVGLPISAKGWSSARYGKVKQKAPETPCEAPTVKAPVEAPPVTVTAVPAPITLLPALPDIIGERGPIRCPFHDDSTPSLQIYDDHFHCFGCGAHGDHFDWLMIVGGMDRDQAMHALDQWDGAKAPPRSREAEEENRKQTLDHTLRLWEAAQPIAGTMAEKYLAEVRKIDPAILPDCVNEALRFHPNCPFGSGVRHPCLVARYTDVVTDEFAGIHRIALRADVFAGAKVQRKSLGSWPRPRAIKLWKANGGLFLGEGIETVLAAAHFQHKGKPVQPVWAAGNADNIRKFPVLGLDLTLLVDHDLNGQGQAAAARCAERWTRAGRSVTQLKPKQPGEDFNDIIMRRKIS